MQLISRFALVFLTSLAVSCSRYESIPGTGGGGGGGHGGTGGGGGVECTADDQCDCHRVCNAAGECVALGAPSPDLAGNAHGNWAGTPGEESYTYEKMCVGYDDCQFGELCNPFTRACIDGAGLGSCGGEHCADGLLCEPETEQCYPPALCYEDRNCCDFAGFTCQGADGDQPGLCLRPQCTPPANVTQTCPFLPKTYNECFNGDFCSAEGRCVACTCDDECSDNRKCNTSSGQCVILSYCNDVVDCEPGQACDTQNHLCSDFCENDTTCGGGKECDPVDHVCRCIIDDHEPNNNAGQATVVPVPGYGSEVVVGGAICRESYDNDWFSLALISGDRITVQTYSGSNLAGKLSAKAPDGASEIALTWYMNDGEIQFTADEDDLYYLHVEGTTTGDFTLTITRDQGVPCDEGGLNDQPSSATLIDPGAGLMPVGCEVTNPTTAEEVITCTDSMYICDRLAGDPDFYVIPIAPNIRLTVELSNFIGGNLDLDLYGPFTDAEELSQTKLLGRAAGSTPTETVSTYSRYGGRYLILVKAKTTSDTAVYDLELTLEADACTDDRYDETTDTPPAFDVSGYNDEAATAAGLDVGLSGETIVPLAVCPGDLDWFEIGHDVDDSFESLPPLHRVTIQVTDATPGPLAALLLFVDSDPVALAAAAVSQTSKAQSFTFETEGGPYYVVVAPDKGVADLFSDYNLVVSIEPPPACDLDDLGDADPADRNDMPAAAHLLTNPPWPADIDDPVYSFPEDSSGVLSLCAFDHDWYRIDVPDNTAVVVDIHYDYTFAEAGLAVYDYRVTSIVEFTPGVPPSQGLLKLDATPGTGHQTVRAEPSVGPAFILVYNRSGWPLTEYTLSVDMAAEGCPIDIFEPNDEATAATPFLVRPSATLPGVEDAFFSGLTICGASDDWFELDLGPGDRIQVFVTYTPEEGNLDLFLYPPDSNTITLAGDSDSGQTGSLKIDYTIATDTVPAPYRIKVDSTGGGVHENDYTFDVRVTRSCIDDRYSPATFMSPFAVDLGQGDIADGNMQLCDTEDWLALTYPAGGDVSVCIRFVHAEIDIDLELYDVYGDPATTDPIDDSLTKRNYEQLIFTANPGATYWTRVFPDFRSIGTTQYSIWISRNADGCPEMCADQVVNGDESDVDCGGSGGCPPCQDGFVCRTGADCASGDCLSGICN